jgi:hypothetical protein
MRTDASVAGVIDAAYFNAHFYQLSIRIGARYNALDSPIVALV